MHPESWGLQIVTQVAKPGCSEPEFSAVPTHAIDLNRWLRYSTSCLPQSSMVTSFPTSLGLVDCHARTVGANSFL